MHVILSPLNSVAVAGHVASLGMFRGSANSPSPTYLLEHFPELRAVLFREVELGALVPDGHEEHVPLRPEGLDLLTVAGTGQRQSHIDDLCVRSQSHRGELVGLSGRGTPALVDLKLREVIP